MSIMRTMCKLPQDFFKTWLDTWIPPLQFLKNKIANIKNDESSSDSVEEIVLQFF